MEGIMSEVGHWLEKIEKYDLFEEAKMKKLDKKLFRYENYLFDQDYNFTPTIYIISGLSDEEVLKEIKKNNYYSFKEELFLEVFKSKDVSRAGESPEYVDFWVQKGKWQETLPIYIEEIKKIVLEKEKKIKLEKENKEYEERKKKEREDEEKRKKFEQYL